MPQMVIANRLSDGRVVFLDTHDRWVESIDAGGLWEGPESAAALERAKAHERASLVVEPALIDVRAEAGRREPVEIREAIRAFGPTVRTDRLQPGR